MKKLTVLIAVLLGMGLATTTHATPVKIYSTDLISNLSVDLSGGDSFRNLRAGEFRFVFNPGAADAYEMISYCVDPYAYFRSGEPYHYEVMPVALYDVDPRRISNEMPDAAYLMNEYALGLNGMRLLGYSARDTAGGLQLAIWKTLFPDIAVNDVQNGGDGNIRAAFDAIMADDPRNGLSEGFFVAFNEDYQDQLIKKVPEPATLMLLGIGFLGLGVVGRRQMKIKVNPSP